MSFFPTRQIFLEIGPLSITWYAVLSILGFIVAYYLSRHTLLKMKVDKEKIEDFLFYLLPVAYVGARLWYCAFEWQRYVKDPISILYIWEGGLAFHGGVFAAVIFSIYYCRKNKIHLLRFGDAIFPNVLIGQMIGRWGNFVNQEAFGPVVSSESLNWLPDFIKDGMYIDGAYHMPTFLYEGIGNLIGFILIRFIFNRYGRKKRGDLMYAYFMWEGMIRFFIEGFRTDSLMIGPLKTAQLVSVALILIGLLGLLGVYDRVFKNYYPFKKEKPVILFDVDGTLIDTIPLITASYKHVIERHALQKELSPAEYKNLSGPPLEVTLKELYPEADGATIDQYAREYREYNLAHHDEMVKVLPGVVEMLDYCKENGYAIGAVSNKVESTVKHGLAFCGIDSYFDVVVCKEQMEKAKPDPDGLLKGCALLNKGHDDLIYCGDSPSDVMAAKNMAAFSVGVVFDEERKDAIEKTHPCAIITEWKQFCELLKEEREWSDNSTLLW